jgi:hypothetical protein
MSACDRGCVKTLFPTQLGDRRTITRMSIVDPRASNSLAVFRNRPFLEFSHSLGRVEMWRGGGRFGLSVAAPFVWRCPSNLTVAPFPHPAHRTGHADLPHPALGQDITPSLRVTPPAVSEHFSELIGCPISRSLTTSCVCLELRPLPSTGVTRLRRYYEPLRHPKAPGLSFAGVRLIIPDHALGLPVLRALSLCTCCRHYPGAAAGSTAVLKSPSHVSLPR